MHACTAGKCGGEKEGGEIGITRGRREGGEGKNNDTSGGNKGDRARDNTPGRGKSKSPGKSKPDKPTSGLCIDFAVTGKCERGKDCKYKHTSSADYAKNREAKIKQANAKSAVA